MELVLAGFAVLAAVGLVASTVTHVRFRARVGRSAAARLPVSELSAVGDGVFARVTGRVSAGSQQLLFSPLSGAPCVWYLARFRIVDKVPGGGADEVELEPTRRGLAHFFLESGEARAIVPLETACVAAFSRRIPFDCSPPGASRKLEQALPAEALEECDRRGVALRDLICTEEILEAGRTVTVVSQFQRQPTPRPDRGEALYRATAFALHAVGTDERPTIVTDSWPRLMEVEDPRLFWPAPRRVVHRGPEPPT